MATSPRLRIETSPKRVRILESGLFIADTQAAKLVWEHNKYPSYFLPVGDVSTQYLFESSGVATSDEYKVYDVDVLGTKKEGVVRWYTKGQLGGLIRFEFGKMEQWFEEDSPIYVHARDPYKRVDCLPSSRHIRVSLKGVTLAECNHPIMVFETFLVTRYYIPITDVALALLRPSKTQTSCPYKGTAHYYDVVLPGGQTSKDVVWSYKFATNEASPVQGLVCFYNEKVDIELDGKPIPRAKAQDRPFNEISIYPA